MTPGTPWVPGTPVKWHTMQRHDGLTWRVPCFGTVVAIDGDVAIVEPGPVRVPLARLQRDTFDEAVEAFKAIMEGRG